MFEQSILADPPKAQKSRTLLVSFLAQIAICGVLLLVPLVYTDAITIFPELAPPVLPPHLVPKPPEVKPSATKAAPARTAPRIFEAPVFRAPATVPAGIAPISDPPPEIGYPGVPNIGIANTGASILTEGIVGPAAPPPPVARVPTPVPPDPPAPPKPVRISGEMQAAKLLTRVVPVYPTIAKLSRTQGVVRLHAIIGRNGRVRDLEVVEGHQLLRQAAVDAVRQWVYRPTMLGTEPVEVETIIEVTFLLR